MMSLDRDSQLMSVQFHLLAIKMIVTFSMCCLILPIFVISYRKTEILLLSPGKREQRKILYDIIDTAGKSIHERRCDVYRRMNDLCFGTIVSRRIR